MHSTTKKIVFAVIALHILALTSPLFFSEEEIKKENKPITVTTYTLPIETKKNIVNTSSSPKKMVAPAKITTPAPKKKKTELKPPLKPSKVKRNTDALQSQLKEIQKSIAKIEEENDKMRTKSKLKDPPKIIFNAKTPKSEIDSAEATAYAASLASYLQAHLQLPDIGEVKIQLTLLKSGAVEKIVVLSAQSKKNRKRLEEDLPKLILPALPKKRASSGSETFTLTFCNEL